MPVARMLRLAMSPSTSDNVPDCCDGLGRRHRRGKSAGGMRPSVGDVAAIGRKGLLDVGLAMTEVQSIWRAIGPGTGVSVDRSLHGPCHILHRPCTGRATSPGNGFRFAAVI